MADALYSPVAYGVCMINNNQEGTSPGFMLAFERVTPSISLTPFGVHFAAPSVTTICHVYAIMRQLLGILRLSDSRCPPDRNKQTQRKPGPKRGCKNCAKKARKNTRKTGEKIPAYVYKTEAHFMSEEKHLTNFDFATSYN